jgi:hypothetical protein
MKIIDNLSKTARIMLLAVIGVCFTFLIIGLVILNIFNIQYESPMAYTIGLSISCIHTLIKVVWLEKSISSSMDADKQGATKLALLHYYGRFALTGGILALAIFFRHIFGLFGIIAGVFSLRIAAFITNHALKDADVE